jgi:hypothetical protein
LESIPGLHKCLKIWSLIFLVKEKNVPFSLENWECSRGWREGANIPCGEGELFIFSGKEGKVLLAGLRNVSLAGEKRVKSLVEREKCSFFQRDRGIFSVLERGGREKGSFEPGEK